jgi:hypothetical protein
MRSTHRTAAVPVHASSVVRPPADNALAQTFLKRSVKMLERMSYTASSEALKAALASPTNMGGVASLLSDLAPLGVDLSAVDPFLEANG